MGFLQWFILTLFFPIFPFNPPENMRKPMVFWCFQEAQKRTLGRKRLIKIQHGGGGYSNCSTKKWLILFMSGSFVTAYVFLLMTNNSRIMMHYT